ncbi:MAG: hypothetical protein GY771_10220 [bacterium]|nr:hypothetical protein [bacterium]
MIRGIIFGFIAMVIVIGAVTFPYGEVEAGESTNEREILTRDYVYIGAESEDGVSITIMPPSEEIMAKYR